MARPSEYKEEYPSQLIDLMKEGKKGSYLYSHFGISRKTFYNWCKMHPDFNDAYEKGWELCEKWWEEYGRNMMLSGSEAGFKPWIAFMNRHFGWSKNNTDQVGGAQINIGSINVFQGQTKDELIAYIQEQVKELPVLEAEFQMQDLNMIEHKDESK